MNWMRLWSSMWIIADATWCLLKSLGLNFKKKKVWGLPCLTPWKPCAVMRASHIGAFIIDTKNPLEHTHTWPYEHTGALRLGTLLFTAVSLSPPAAGCHGNRAWLETTGERKKEIRCSAHLFSTPPLCPSLKIPPPTHDAFLTNYRFSEG